MGRRKERRQAKKERREQKALAESIAGAYRRDHPDATGEQIAEHTRSRMREVHGVDFDIDKIMNLLRAFLRILALLT